MRAKLTKKAMQNRPVFVLKYGQRYHRSDCYDFLLCKRLTLKEAEQRGYVPCTKCCPDVATYTRAGLIHCLRSRIVYTPIRYPMDRAIQIASNNIEAEDRMIGIMNTIELHTAWEFNGRPTL